MVLKRAHGPVSCFRGELSFLHNSLNPLKSSRAQQTALAVNSHYSWPRLALISSWLPGVKQSYNYWHLNYVSVFQFPPPLFPVQESNFRSGAMGVESQFYAIDFAERDIEKSWQRLFAALSPLNIGILGMLGFTGLFYYSILSFFFFSK